MKISFDFEDHAGGLQPAARGHVVFEPSHKHLHADNGLGTIRPFTIKFNKPFIVDLEATTPGWAWKITVTTGADTFVGYYAVTRDSDFTKLVSVDPESLEPDTEPEPAWWAMARSTVNGGEVIDGHLWLTRADGTRFDAGVVQGSPGKDGRDGVDGSPGRDGTNATVTDVAIADALEAGVGKSINVLAKTFRKKDRLNILDYGCLPGGEYNNSTNFDTALDEARARKLPLYIPAGVWYSTGSHDISGVNLEGDLSGYYSQNGSIITGSGLNDLLVQKQVNLANITCSITGLRVENTLRALVLSYSIYSTFTDCVFNSIGDAVTLGVNTIIGPIWNVFTRVKAKSDTASALVLGGKDWCNSNQFDTCDFNGFISAIKINSLGGFGALDNIFRNTEIRGAGCGLDIVGTNRATTLESCYIEPKGPGVVVRANTLDLQLTGNVYGSTRNDVSGYSPRFIDHKSGSLNVKVNGGWVTTNNVPEQADLSFIGSDVPASLTLEYVSEPSISAMSTGFRLQDTSIISAAPKIQRGDFIISKHSVPRINLQYPDGSRQFSIRRNGSQGGTDFGVYFRNENVDSCSIDSVGNFNVLQNLGTAKSMPATTLGSVVSRLPIYNSSGALIGQIPIYGVIT